MKSPNIPGWARLEACPESPGCTAKVLWQDADKALWRLDTRTGEFVPHHCRVVGSECPVTVFIGEWKNSRTGRTRWVGPHRLRRSAETPPPGNPKEWNHIQTLIGSITWDKLPVSK